LRAWAKIFAGPPGSWPHHGDLDHGVLAGVGDEECRLVAIEPETVRSEGRNAGGAKQRIVDPDGGDAAAGRSLPDDALRAVGDVDVARVVEGEVVQPGASGVRQRRGQGDERLGVARPRVHREHLAGAEVVHQENAGVGMEREPEEVRAGGMDRNLPQQAALLVEDGELSLAGGGAGGSEPEAGDVDVTAGPDREAFRARGARRQNREGADMPSVPGVRRGCEEQETDG
jgi:hypothetical protein